MAKRTGSTRMNVNSNGSGSGKRDRIIKWRTTSAKKRRGQMRMLVPGVDAPF